MAQLDLLGAVTLVKEPRTLCLVILQELTPGPWRQWPYSNCYRMGTVDMLTRGGWSPAWLEGWVLTTCLEEQWGWRDPRTSGRA
jgi:hypothetical protein